MQAANPALVHPQLLAQMSTVSAGYMQPQVSSSCKSCCVELCLVVFFQQQGQASKLLVHSHTVLIWRWPGSRGAEACLEDLGR